jgi:hydrogenase maturation protease
VNDPRPNVRPPEPAAATLLLGIGNSGRGDDGLGWAFLDRIRRAAAFAGRLEYRYQLQVEDAALISSAQRVVFVDSWQGELPGGFCWQPCAPAADFEFTTHALSPQAVMHLCRDLYRRIPRAHLLTIQGSRWDLSTGLSPAAEGRLEQALRFFRERMAAGDVVEPD